MKKTIEISRALNNVGLTASEVIPTIIKKYGKEVFEITDNYIKYRIPYNEKVLDMSKKNVGINERLDKKMIEKT